MSARVQSSPFRETEFDQRLDRMLDDLKSTVNTDDEGRRTPLGVRSTSRSSSRAGSVGRRGDSVNDGGRLTHHRKEYTSPDQNVKTVADTYQYDSGSSHPSGNFQKKVVKSTYSSYNVDGGLSAELEALKRGPSDLEMERALTQESRNILNSTTYNSSKTNGVTANSKVVDASQEVARELVGALSCIGGDGRSLSNGHVDDDVIVNDEKGGEVRRIVWRNRYEKTYETTDNNTDTTNTTPLVSIENDAKNRRYNANAGGTLDQSDATTFSSLTRSHVPPQISPGSQSWADPVPLPTPPQQVSPREPGVAYIYNYGSSGGSAVQPLPPLNYVAVAPPNSDARAPSPTPSSVTQGQPVIYHYSYHYTIQPGQSLPEGAHPPSSPPALQIVSPPATGFSSQSTDGTNVHSFNKTSNVINEIHRTTNRDIHHHNNTTKTTSYGRPDDREPLNSQYNPNNNKPVYPGDRKPGSNSVNYSVNTTNFSNETHHHPFPTMSTDKTPRDPTFDNRDPSDGRPTDPNRNVTININKTTTHTTHSTNSRNGSEYPPNDNQLPLTSTPYRGGSRSPERRYPAEPRYPSDSLDRVRRPPQSGLPFPDASPVKPQDPNRIPRKVDDLMTAFPNKNGGPFGPGYHGHPDSEPLLTGVDSRRTKTEVNQTLIPHPERNEINTVSPSKIREEREKSKNLSGPPVYYPPGHEAFSESMHTMTLNEGGRRGKAKWRAEAASGYQESSSHSESKGGVKMVPVCLPLCCGAACTIM